MRGSAATLLTIAAWLAWAVPVCLAIEPAIVVIGAAGSVDPRVDRETVARVFLRKQTLWANGLRAQPVNLPAGNATRIGFSEAVLGRAPDAWQDYWRDMYFHGVLPPHVVASEEAVLRFVASTPGAIGYVAGCPRADGVVVLLALGATLECRR